MGLRLPDEEPCGEVAPPVRAPNKRLPNGLLVFEDEPPPPPSSSEVNCGAYCTKVAKPLGCWVVVGGT